MREAPSSSAAMYAFSRISGGRPRLLRAGDQRDEGTKAFIPLSQIKAKLSQPLH
jgi:hypothetical protein